MQVPELHTFRDFYRTQESHFNELLTAFGCLQFLNHAWKSSAQEVCCSRLSAAEPLMVLATWYATLNLASLVRPC